MLDGQRQGVDIPAHARTVHNGLLQKTTGRDSLLDRPSCPLDDPIAQGTKLNRTTNQCGVSHLLAVYNPVNRKGVLGQTQVNESQVNL